MEIVVPSTDECRFDSAASTPFLSAPSSPRSVFSDSFNYSYPCYRSSAPTSPTASSIPFAWEDTPGTPRSPKSSSRVYDDDGATECGFAFQFSGLDNVVTAADQLFEKGKIRPLKPPPAGLHSPQSPKSPTRRLWHGKERERDLDPFTAAMVISSRSRKGSRSLSPVRAGVVAAAEGVRPGGRKWRLRDLFLFRSASEGHVVRNRNKVDPACKYARKAEDSSFGYGGSGGSSKGIASVHYKVDRTLPEEVKKKRTDRPFHGHGLFASLARRFS